MDVDNNMLLERYFSSHNSPYEKTYKVSKHIKFVEPQSFEKDLLNLYSESGTNNLPAIYNIVENAFKDQEMTLSHSEKYNHTYVGVNGDYEIEAVQTHFLHPRPKVDLYSESRDLSNWTSLAIFKRNTGTALFRI
tara:strand:+ start:166 stop:570 length:405 start_codon:yes stop_codon:yes gene_type:complete